MPLAWNTMHLRWERSPTNNRAWYIVELFAHLVYTVVQKCGGENLAVLAQLNSCIALLMSSVEEQSKTD